MRRALSLLEHALAAALRRRGRNLAIAFGIALVPLGLNFVFQILGRKVSTEERLPKGVGLAISRDGSLRGFERHRGAPAGSACAGGSPASASTWTSR